MVKASGGLDEDDVSAAQVPVAASKVNPSVRALKTRFVEELPFCMAFEIFGIKTG